MNLVAPRSRTHPATGCLFALTLLSIALRAQTTWIVDQGGGPGHHFTSLAPAIASATAGDTILVQPGAYNEGSLTIDKGLSILGSLAVSITLSGLGTPGIVIENVPADEAVVLRGMRVGGTILSSAILARDCDGLVLLEHMEGTIGPFGIPEQLGFGIERCQQVHVHDVFVRGGPRVSILDSRAVITSSVLEGDFTAVLVSTDSEVTLDHCTLTLESQSIQWSPPAVVDGGRLDVTRSTITAPDSPTTPLPAMFATNNPTLRIDPTATLTPATGQPLIQGPAIVHNQELVSLSRAHAAGGTVLDLQGRVGAIYATFVSLPHEVLPLPWGDVWLNLETGQQIRLDVGVLNQRVHQATFATAGLPTGLALSVQCAVLDQQLTISNGIGFVAH